MEATRRATVHGRLVFGTEAVGSVGRRLLHRGTKGVCVPGVWLVRPSTSAPPVVFAQRNPPRCMGFAGKGHQGAGSNTSSAGWPSGPCGTGK